MKKIWNLLNLGIAHSLLFYMAVLVITPKKMPLYPIIVWSGMIIFSGIIVRFYWNKISGYQSAAQFRKAHKKTSRAALCSTFIFSLTCISFEFSNYIIITSILIFFTVFSIVYTILFHIESIDNKERTLALRVKVVVKYSWVIVSLISYYLARSLMSNSLDVPFDKTLNKLMTVVVALFFIFIFYYLLYFILIAFLSIVTPRNKWSRRNSHYDINYSMSFFVPLFIIGYVSYVVFDMQTLSVIKLGFEFSMKYDTRDTFFCNNTYMLLNEHPNAHFMYISEGSYRVLIPHNDDFTISRLTCKGSEPFYSLVSVKNKKDLMLATLEKRTETLASDLKATMSP